MPEVKDRADVEKHDSILLKHQLALLALLNPSIHLELIDNGHTLIASDISEKDMIDLEIITNDPAHGARIHVDLITVSLDDEKRESRVYGFYDICLEKIETEDVLSYTKNLKSFKPFKNGFQNGITVNELCDQLSLLATNSPDTVGRVKKYRIKFGNCSGWPGTGSCGLW
jgi:hypothetical protein